MSRKSILFNLLRLLTAIVAAIMATACIASTANIAHVTLDQMLIGSDEDLMRALAQLGKEGAAAICNPHVLEKKLSIAIDELEHKENTYANDTKGLWQSASAHFVNSKVQTELDFIKFYRVRYTGNVEKSICYLSFRFKNRKICEFGTTQAGSGKFDSIMETPLTFFRPHEADSKFTYTYHKQNTEITLFLANNYPNCFNGITIKSDGEWK